MKDYRYALIRFVKDPERMEPINAGIILQGDDRVDFVLQPHFARRRDVLTSAWGAWRRFFEKEIRGDVVPLFQPDHRSVQFLTYLSGLSTPHIIVSEPLLLSVSDDATFDEALEALYQRLAAPPEEEPRAASRRPTARFKELSEERHFLKRGMKKSAFVHAGGQPLWHAFRQVKNGVHIAIDKVEVGLELHLTATEIQTLALVMEHLPRFLERRPGHPPRAYILLADALERPFTDQSEEDFSEMSRLLNGYLERVADSGGRVVTSPEDVVAVSEDIERSLDPLTDEE